MPQSQSSLAQQLRSAASAHGGGGRGAGVGTSSARPSLLFTAKEAAALGAEEIRALATNGILELRRTDERFGQYAKTLLAAASAELDRDLVSPDDERRIAESTVALLRLLSPLLLLRPAQKVLEYLVRVYRVHEFSATALLLAALPYHQTRLFARLLDLAHLGSASGASATVFGWLAPVKRAQSPLPRSALVKQALSDPSLLLALLAEAQALARLGIKSRAHCSLLAAFGVELLSATVATGAGGAGLEALLPRLLPPLLEVLADSPPHTELGAAALSLAVQCGVVAPLNQDAAGALLGALGSALGKNGANGGAELLISGLALVAAAQKPQSLPPSTVSALAQHAETVSTLGSLGVAAADLGALLLLAALRHALQEGGSAVHYARLLGELGVRCGGACGGGAAAATAALLSEVCSAAESSGGAAGAAGLFGRAAPLLSSLEAAFPSAVEEALGERIAAGGEGLQAVERLIAQAQLGARHMPLQDASASGGTGTTLLLALSQPSLSVRLNALGAIERKIEAQDGEAEEAEEAEEGGMGVSSAPLRPSDLRLCVETALASARGGGEGEGEGGVGGWGADGGAVAAKVLRLPLSALLAAFSRAEEGSEAERSLENDGGEGWGGQSALLSLCAAVLLGECPGCPELESPKAREKALRIVAHLEDDTIGAAALILPYIMPPPSVELPAQLRSTARAVSGNNGARSEILAAAGRLAVTPAAAGRKGSKGGTAKKTSAPQQEQELSVVAALAAGVRGGGNCAAEALLLAAETSASPHAAAIALVSLGLAVDGELGLAGAGGGAEQLEKEEAVWLARRALPVALDAVQRSQQGREEPSQESSQEWEGGVAAAEALLADGDGCGAAGWFVLARIADMLRRVGWAAAAASAEPAGGVKASALAPLDDVSSYRRARAAAAAGGGAAGDGGGAMDEDEELDSDHEEEEEEQGEEDSEGEEQERRRQEEEEEDNEGWDEQDSTDSASRSICASLFSALSLYRSDRAVDVTQRLLAGACEAQPRSQLVPFLASVWSSANAPPCARAQAAVLLACQLSSLPAGSAAGAAALPELLPRLLPAVQAAAPKQLRSAMLRLLSISAAAAEEGPMRRLAEALVAHRAALELDGAQLAPLLTQLLSPDQKE